MSYDYLQVSLPMAERTDKRVLELQAIAKSLTLEQVTGWIETFGPIEAEDDGDGIAIAGLGSADDDIITNILIRRRFARYVDEYWWLADRADVGISRPSATSVASLVTGGMSCGDDPTESFGVMHNLDIVPIITDQLLAWGREDVADCQPRLITDVLSSDATFGTFTDDATHAVCDAWESRGGTKLSTEEKEACNDLLCNFFREIRELNQQGDAHEND